MMKLKKLGIIFMVSLIFTLVTEYVFSCIAAKQVLEYLEITLKQLGLIIAFTVVICCIFKFSDKKELVSYFLPVIVFYVIYHIVFSLDLFTYTLFTMPLMGILILLLVSTLILAFLLKRNRQ